MNKLEEKAAVNYLWGIDFTLARILISNKLAGTDQYVFLSELDGPFRDYVDNGLTLAAFVALSSASYYYLKGRNSK